jgi:uncharacterized protein (TIGR02680 family)
MPTSLSSRPDLPQPMLARWQPLRIGLVEMYHYDAEEFWFRDGHLLLRGNNGTGKSKVLSLTLPFLFDAQLRSSRIEPDGDPGKKMAWNLLMSSYERRIGYAWIEFGRLGDDGTPRFLTLGAGLMATAARAQVESWFFVLEGGADEAGPRIGEDLWLTNSQRTVLTRERLRDAIEGRGHLFETAASYRRAVDERLFHLGQKRYDALMDTLIQLRQPQLSKKPDETALSNALTEALPPLPAELLADVAEALNQLEEDRRQLQEYQQLALAVQRFERRYRVYAGTRSRRQARGLRQAQTEFDNASRERNDAQTHSQDSAQAAAAAQAAHEDAELQQTVQRSRLDTLQSDPAMQDANRMQFAESEARARQVALEAEYLAHTDADARLKRESEAGILAEQRAKQAEDRFLALRDKYTSEAAACGVAVTSDALPLGKLPMQDLAELTTRDFDTASNELRMLATARHDQIRLLRLRHAQVGTAMAIQSQQQCVRDEKRVEAEDAAQRRVEADAAVEDEGRRLVDAWREHCANLQQLQLDADASLAALAEWALQVQGENPARQALQSAQQQASLRLATRQLELQHRGKTLREEQATLAAERERLAAGEDRAPPAPHTRGPDTRVARPGAPLWQLVDFHDHVDARARAGLEAALEVSGLLDAWVTPDGRLIPADGLDPWHDSQWIARPHRRSASLGAWISCATAADKVVPAAIVERLLAGVACSMDPQDDAETWIAPDGRFRTGTLSGAWNKPAAVYIGYAARTAARLQRLVEIVRRLERLAAEQLELQRQLAQHAADRQRAEDEWQRAPADLALREAHLSAGARAREFAQAHVKLDRAEASLREATHSTQAAVLALETDATDLRLPKTGAGLEQVEAALERFNDARHQLTGVAQEWRRAWPEWRSQLARIDDAGQRLKQHDEKLSLCRIEAEKAKAHFEVLRDSVGAQVDALRARLDQARKDVLATERATRMAIEVARKAGEERAVAVSRLETAERTLQQRGEVRMYEIARLQQFAATSLLSAALPDLELPDLRTPWTIEPALSLARRAEQALASTKDDDETWSRVQKQLGEDIGDLQRSLTALGHQAPGEQGDFGMVVHIIYQNRPERPDQLALRLADEIAQRSELLTANERTVLENHLQAEIAAEVQRLLQAAEKRVDAINKELHKRPTSTGVRYRLRWLPLAEGDGAPIGLEAARKRLLNTGADLWSSEDKRVVGAMLQQRIAAERERPDDAGHDGNLIDQLARALDYRRWHQFRVERLQDGQWRKLSGPASSGERALGLTVPLFAAIASFYSQGSSIHAPRLMLLDEAFAGIDDAARAHCMGLIREFDLDFVITSEREWACYAELPGVSICQLQRREGIDAVFVSRWTWDGRAKRQESDPDRRFARPS